MGKRSPDNKLQQPALEDKIVMALERVSQALRVLQWQEGKDLGLTPTQSQVLAFLATHDLALCKVGSLSDEFGLTKASVSDTVKALEQRGLLVRVPDPDDARSHALKLTREGKSLAAKSMASFSPLMAAVGSLPSQDREAFYLNLLQVIRHLHLAGVITVQRMCATCVHHSQTPKGQQHYCKLLQQPLAPDALRLDCAEHEAA